MNNITALVLAGGRGSRMGGVDKGLQHFRGEALVNHALRRLQQQEGGLIHTVVVNANRNLSAYETLNVPVLPDASPEEFAGPLAGFLTGLERCETPYLLTVPCDTPLFPRDLAQRLWQALEKTNAEIAMACAPETDDAGRTHTRPQPVFCLIQASLKESLAAFMQHGGRKIDAWTAQHRVAWAKFDTPADNPQAFANANTLQELQALE
jgi:molybdenum cofactor guanylyltransferase